MKESHTINGIEDDNFASNFQLDINYENIDNTLNLPTYKTPYGTTIFEAKETQSIFPSNMYIYDNISHSNSSGHNQVISDIK